ncbi:MAG: SIR2 family protein [Deltaproteobacteria bacterium]|nr:SIR2 family protein [Deltaproteobacteria bacterium]
MTRILLLGAGFSSNWGGPLASDVFDWLLQRPEISGDARLKQQLWNDRNAGGFENTLSQVQSDYLRSPNSENEERLRRFQKAINEIFADMDRGFATFPSWEFQEERHRMLSHALVKFDAIFTLNQDLLFERYYLNAQGFDVSLETNQRLLGCLIPGMKETRENSAPHPYDIAWSKWTPLPSPGFKVPDRFQPYFKLHGSYRWDDGTGKDLMVIGGSKSLTIQSYQVLKWFFAEFQRYLAMGATRLMVIGYGFNDPHINNALLDAAPKGLKIFIIDPLGVDAADPTRHLPLRMPNPFQDVIESASKRPLSDTFGRNAVEHARVMKFFQ